MIKCIAKIFNLGRYILYNNSDRIKAEETFANTS